MAALGFTFDPGAWTDPTSVEGGNAGYGMDPSGPGWTENPPVAVQVPTNRTDTQPQGNNTDWWSRVTGVGLSALGAVLGYNLQQNQINRGMYPSIGYQGGFLPTGQGVTGLSAGNTSWLFWIVIAVVVLMLLRR